jgi:hypothetical protein
MQVILLRAQVILLCNKTRSTVCLLIKLNATVTSRLPPRTARLTAKRYKVFPIRVKYRSIKTTESTHRNHSSSCQEPGSDTCVQLYRWTHCIFWVMSLHSRSCYRLYACAGVTQPQGGMLQLSKRVAVSEPRHYCGTTIMAKSNEEVLIYEVQSRRPLWRDDVAFRMKVSPLNSVGRSGCSVWHDEW